MTPSSRAGVAERSKDMAEPSDDMVWLFDSVTQFLKGPEWAVPVWDFIDDNCIVFDSEDENKLAYIDIFVRRLISLGGTALPAVILPRASC